jgi:hypothetical protein
VQTGSSMQTQEAVAVDSTGQQQSSSVEASGRREAQTDTAGAGTVATTGNPPSEGTGVTYMTVPGSDRHPAATEPNTDRSQAAPSSSSSSRAAPQQRQTRPTSTQQQQQQQSNHEQQLTTPAVHAAAAAAAAAPAMAVQAPGSSGSRSHPEQPWASQSGWLAASTGAMQGTVAGSVQQAQPPPVNPAPLPGVAGLFLQLSERRSPGGVAAASPSPTGPASGAGAAGSGPGNSNWQSQPLHVTSSSSGGLALHPAVAATPPAPTPSSNRSGGNSSTPMRTPVAAAVGPSSVAAAAAGIPPALVAAQPRPVPSPISSPAQPSPVSHAGRQAVVRRPIRVGRECVVCMEARSCVLQHPCGHLCCCEACMQLLLGKSQECPMCRTQVAEYWVL